MAMSTTLFAVTSEKLESLEANPESIGTLDSKLSLSTYLWQSLPYFLSAEDEEEEEDDEEDEDEDEDEDEEEEEEDDDEANDLAAVLAGDDSVKCPSLENGAFYTISAERVAELSALLVAVKPSEIKKRVLGADLEEVHDGEVYEELEQLDLTEPDAAAAAIVKDLKALVKFYAETAKKGLGLVMYTS